MKKHPKHAKKVKAKKPKPEEPKTTTKPSAHFVDDWEENDGLDLEKLGEDFPLDGDDE